MTMFKLQLLASNGMLMTVAGTIIGPLWTRWWNFGFSKKQRIWLYERNIFFSQKTLLIKLGYLNSYYYAGIIMNITRIKHTECPVTLWQYFRISSPTSFPVRDSIWTWVRFSAVAELWKEIEAYLNEKKTRLQFVLPAWRGPTLFNRHSTQYLNEQFPDIWIGRGGP
jgi:hypothetical protein